MSEVLALLVSANLAAALAVVLVLACRIPARRVFGARLAYCLWLLVPVAFLANLVPREIASEASDLPVITLPAPLKSGLDGEVFWIWLAGFVASAAWIAWGQVRFLRHAARGSAGPAVVGVFAPRMVVPGDHHLRYSPAERDLIRAHERAHIDRGDTRANALIALAQCLNWFNPLVHLAAHYARLDQELACDATVIARHPGERRRYAQTMLKVQLAPTLLPFGCHWTAHPLETRIALLGIPAPSDDREMAGGFALATVLVLAGLAAWTLQPERTPLHRETYFEPYPTVSWRCWPAGDPAANRCARTIASDTAPDNVPLLVSLRSSSEIILLPPRRPAAS